MDVIAISASPRLRGTSETLLKYVIEEIESRGVAVALIRTHELLIEPCNGCGSCERSGRCGIDDDFPAIAERLVRAEGIVFATPLYFMNVPARGKALIDRCQAFWIAKHRLNAPLRGGAKIPALLVACSGAARGPGGSDVFRGLLDTMTYVFDALDTDGFETVLLPGRERCGADILETAIMEARAGGQRLAERIRAGGDR